MQQINVEEIMQQIRAEIKEKGYREAGTACEADGTPASCHMAGQMKEAAYIAWCRPLPPGIKGLVKKVIRKCVGFIVAPAAEDQTRFNGMAVSVAEQLSEMAGRQQAELDKQKETIRALEERISYMENKSP